jgi:hypothetical protein
MAGTAYPLVLAATIMPAPPRISTALTMDGNLVLVAGLDTDRHSLDASRSSWGIGTKSEAMPRISTTIPAQNRNFQAISSDPALRHAAAAAHKVDNKDH